MEFIVYDKRNHEIAGTITAESLKDALFSFASEYGYSPEELEVIVFDCDYL